MTRDKEASTDHGSHAQFHTVLSTVRGGGAEDPAKQAVVGIVEEPSSGDLVRQWLAFLKVSSPASVRTKDLKVPLSLLMAVKDDKDLRLHRKSTEVLEKFFNRGVEPVLREAIFNPGQDQTTALQ